MSLSLCLGLFATALVMPTVQTLLLMSPIPARLSIQMENDLTQQHIKAHTALTNATGTIS